MATAKKSTAKKVATKKTARKKSTSTFSEHLERIKSTKQQCDMLAINSPLDVRSASITLLWEIVFDTLCNHNELEISDFNTIAGIIQKLASSRVQEIPSASAEQSQNTNSDFSISPEILAKIEQQLKLL